jgi:RNA-directed DNA polymerase
LKRLYALNICDVKHLCCHLGTDPKELERICSGPSKYYRKEERNIKGKIRSLSTPRKRLLEIQKSLNRLLQRIMAPETIHGGLRGHSHITNAIPHTQKPMVITNDLKDFFPSISYKKVYDVFLRRLGCKPDIARYLTKLTTIDGCLPQGSPTSTILSALVSEPLAKRLEGLAKKHGSTYTQYVDDITFSGSAHIGRLNPLIKKIVNQEGFKVNPSKTKVMDNGCEQVVTGVRVNQGADVPSEKIQEVRNLIDELEVQQRSERKISESEAASLRGKIQYVTQLNRGAGRSLQRRLGRVLNRK